ncbi:FHA domain-containing protein, partial [Tahibacter caeni]|uniref:FHA domain-containing protein n=1 Tax=Tahibacter caeni TaxID=1453545 RepID=UPI0021496833
MSAVRLELVVLSYNGQALAAPLSRALDTPVNVGRGSDNDLPLNDPERLISRHQARLCLGPAGTVDISNLSSSSSLFINGSELAPGRSCTMSPSDQLLIGRYVLGLRPASLPAAPAITSPPSPPPLSTPVTANIATAMPSPMPPAPTAVAATMPPATAPPAMTPASTRPAGPRPAPVPPAMPMATKPKPAQTIPDDFDVFAIPAPPTSPYSLPNDDVVIEDYNEKAAVREVFSELQALGSDVIAESPEELQQRQRLLDTNRDALDPLAMLNGSGSDVVASTSLDHGLEIDSLFVLPSAPDRNAPASPVPPVTIAPSPPAYATTAPPPAAATAASGSVAAAERMMADLLGSGPALDPASAVTTFDDLRMPAASSVAAPLPPQAPAYSALPPAMPVPPPVAAATPPVMPAAAP